MPQCPRDSVVPSALNCYSCKHYHNGKGSKPCLKCNKLQGILPRNKPCAISYPIPETALENMVSSSKALSILESISKLDSRSGTMFCQRFIMSMSFTEIAEYHHCSVSHTFKTISEAKNIIGELLSLPKENT